MKFSERYQKRVLDVCARRLGDTATYRSADAGAVDIEIEGVPSRETLDIIIGGGTNSKSRKATFGVNMQGLIDRGIHPKEGDSLRLRSVDFKIKWIDYDGEGGATLVLQKVNP